MEEFNANSFSTGQYSSKEQFLDHYVPKDDDRGVIAEFKVEPVLMGFKSKEANREIYEDREFVRILVKGNDKMEVVAEVTDQHRRRFPFQYERFKAGMAQLKSGTPIDRVPGISPSTVKNYISLNIRTIEDLAEVGDNVLDNLGMGARDNREKAIKYLANGRVANDEAASKVRALEEKVAELTALVESMSAVHAPKPRGRPPKARAEAA